MVYLGCRKKWATGKVWKGLRYTITLIQQDNGNLTWRRHPQSKYPNLVKLGQNPDYSKRPHVVIRRSRPVAK